MNIAGVIVIALGALLIIIALRGTQDKVFPWFFSSSGSSSGGGGNTKPTIPGLSCDTYKCPSGSQCVMLLGIPTCTFWNM